MPITFATMLTGWLAISEFRSLPDFSRRTKFFIKLSLRRIFRGVGIIFLWIAGLVTAVLTAVYMTRMMVMTFWGEERFHQELPTAKIRSSLQGRKKTHLQWATLRTRSNRTPIRTPGCTPMPTANTTRRTTITMTTTNIITRFRRISTRTNRRGR